MSTTPDCRRWAVAALVLLGCAAASAQDAGDDTTDTPLTQPAEYAGIVTVQASTSLGHLFAARFTEAWTRQPQRNSVVLEVRERISPRFGTEVRIATTDEEVFRAVLPRAAFAVVSMARDAAEIVNNRLAEAALQRLLFDDLDLARTPY